MKRLLLLSIIFLSSNLSLLAQSNCDIFRAYLINKQYDVFLKIDLCDESIVVPGQDLYGSLPGYFGKRTNSFCWVITSAEVNGKKAMLTMINDFGSEDLVASLTQKNDSVYILRQEEGSTLKMAQGGKWQKMPKTLELKREKSR